MQNSRPNQNIDLPLVGGENVSCTIAQPKQKRVKDVRALLARLETKAESCNGIYKLTTGINGRLSQATVDLARLKASNAAQADIDAATAIVEQTQAELDDVLSQVDALNDEQYDIVVSQVKLIINIPNAKDGTPRTPDVIDWDDADVSEMQEAISFFLNGPKK